jgi:hypothetical protein
MRSIYPCTKYLSRVPVLTIVSAATAITSVSCNNSPTEPLQAVSNPSHAAAAVTRMNTVVTGIHNPMPETVLANGTIGGSLSTIGVGASSSFQDNWLDPLTYAWNNAWGFWDEAAGNVANSFIYNLQGGKGWWEGPSSLINTVDYFYGVTHGGNWTNPNLGAYAMWDKYPPGGNNGDGQSNAFTNNMYLHGLGFFTYACDTQADDGGMMDRWVPTFRGGLRIATGAFDLVTDGPTLDDTGQNFVDNMVNHNEVIAYAWADAVHSLYLNSQSPSTIATGVSWNDCLNRLHGMTVSNITTYPQYTDGGFSWMCAYQVQN